MDSYDIMKKLIGPIEPIGDSNIDEKIFSNLKKYVDILDKLINDIKYVSSYANSQEYSVSKCGTFAEKALVEFGIK